MSGHVVNQRLAGALVLAILTVHLPEQPISADDTLLARLLRQQDKSANQTESANRTGRPALVVDANFVKLEMRLKLTEWIRIQC